MKAWIIYNTEGAAYNKQYIEFYIQEGLKLGIEVKLILVEELEFGVRNNTWFILYQKQALDKPDFTIGRTIYPLLSKQLELMGIPVFNSASIAEICNDKAKTYQYLARTGITMVDSSFYKNVQLKDVLSKIEGPTVVKAVDGHGGSQVFLTVGKPGAEKTEAEITGAEITEVGKCEAEKSEAVESEIMKSDVEKSEVENYKAENLIVESSKELSEVSFSSVSEDYIIAGIKTSDVVVQPLTGNRHQDLRVYVIGKEIIAAVLRTAKEGFKSNFSLGGEVQLYSLSEQEQDIVNRIIREFDFGLVGIDFIIGDDGELIFNEIEDVVGSRMLYQCSDVNIVRLYLEFIQNRLRKQSHEY